MNEHRSGWLTPATVEYAISPKKWFSILKKLPTCLLGFCWSHFKCYGHHQRIYKSGAQLNRVGLLHIPESIFLLLESRAYLLSKRKHLFRENATYRCSELRHSLGKQQLIHGSGKSPWKRRETFWSPVCRWSHRRLYDKWQTMARIVHRKPTFPNGAGDWNKSLELPQWWWFQRQPCSTARMV